MYVELALFGVPFRIGHGWAIGRDRQGGISFVIIVMVVVMIVAIVMMMVMSDVPAIMSMRKTGE